jgi:hypothetical protein
MTRVAAVADVKPRPTFWRMFTMSTPVSPSRKGSRPVAGRMPARPRSGQRTSRARVKRRAASVIGGKVPSNALLATVEAPQRTAPATRASRARVSAEKRGRASDGKEAARSL